MPVVGDITLVRENTLAEQVVLVDGLTRTGKSMLGPILASFERVEIERVEAIFEYVALLHALGKISADAASHLLRLEADTKLSESMIGRNVNFRRGDHSGVFNNPFKLRYVRRLFAPEGAPALAVIRRQRPIFQVQTHDTLGMIDPFFPAFGDGLRVVEMLRDPVDLAHSWHRRGWGERFTTDPLSFTFTYQRPDGPAPWYGMLLDESYHRLPPVDRILFMIRGLYRRTIDTFSALPAVRKAQVLWIVFDRFVTDPDPDIERIETFLATRRTSATRATLRRERCPRVLSESERLSRRTALREASSAAAWNAMDEIADMHAYMERLA